MQVLKQKCLNLEGIRVEQESEALVSVVRNSLRVQLSKG